MITLLVLGYAYTVWLFTAHNPMPHLDPDLILLAIPEFILEALFVMGIYLLIQKLSGVNNDR